MLELRSPLIARSMRRVFRRGVGGLMVALLAQQAVVRSYSSCADMLGVAAGAAMPTMAQDDRTMEGPANPGRSPGPLSDCEHSVLANACCIGIISSPSAVVMNDSISLDAGATVPAQIDGPLTVDISPEVPPPRV